MNVMKPWLRVAAVLAALAIAGCGGGGGGGTSPGVPGAPATSVRQALDTAATAAANDSSINSNAPFTVVQAAGVPAVTIKSPPKLNFAVFSDGKVVRDLTITNVTAAIAKLVPGPVGEIDQ